MAPIIQASLVFRSFSLTLIFPGHAGSPENVVSGWALARVTPQEKWIKRNLVRTLVICIGSYDIRLLAPANLPAHDVARQLLVITVF
jgi:hypothetical protein